MKKRLFTIISILFIITLKNYAQEIRNWNYPVIKPDTAIDYYFGKKVTDTFRNLEDTNNALVKAWMKKQNEFYDTIVNNISNNDSLGKEIGEIQNREKKWPGHPRAAGNRIFYPLINLDDDIQRLVYIDSLNCEPIELFSTKEINEKDSSIYSFNYYEPSFDGKYIAFGISADGTEKANISILEVESKKLLPEKIERSMMGNIQWLPDGTGFFYTQDKILLTEEDKNTPNEDSKVKLHKLFTDPKDDKEIFSRFVNKNLNLEKVDIPMLFTFFGSDKVLINTMKVTGQYYPIYYGELEDILNKPAEAIVWKKICDFDEKIGSNVLYGNAFFGISCKHNPNGQLVMMKLPDLKPKVLLEGNGISLEDMVLTQNNLYVTSIENGLNKLIKVNPSNYQIDDINLPFYGALSIRPSFSVVSFYQPSEFLLFSLTALNKQWNIFQCGTNKEVHKTEISQDVDYSDYQMDLIVEEVQAPSHDGVMVPLSLVYKKDIKLDGNNPAIIQAYGAYGISNKPYFSDSRLAWLSKGGIFAVAHVRGGYEKGDDWYMGGFKATKPNSWKDLIACANYMIKNKYTAPKKLAVMGSSAGGITIGRAITERPDLFKAAVIYVGILNTVRMENTFNPYIAEFGTVKDSLEFQYLYNMDTYLHINEGVNYPSVLFTASINDARVSPWEPAKAAAKMQEVSNSNNIILFRIGDEGHFDYPSVIDVYSFLFWQLGHPDFKLKEKSSMFKPVK